MFLSFERLPHTIIPAAERIWKGERKKKSRKVSSGFRITLKGKQLKVLAEVKM